MKAADMEEKVLGRVAVTENDTIAIGHWARLDMLFQAVPFREAIFCEGTLHLKILLIQLKSQPAKQNLKFMQPVATVL